MILLVLFILILHYNKLILNHFISCLASSSSSPSMRFPYVKSEPTSNIKVCCFCGYPGTNPVQCERCLVTRQTSGGMVYRKCNFCRQIGTSTQVCEKCKRCPHCGNYVLPPNSVCQRCKTNGETF